MLQSSQQNVVSDVVPEIAFFVAVAVAPAALTPHCTLNTHKTTSNNAKKTCPKLLSVRGQKLAQNS